MHAAEANGSDRRPVGPGTEIDSATETVGQVLRSIVTHPVDRLVRHWNWKSAVLSSAFRSAIFFTANLSAGLDAATAALITEFVFRGIASGFYGAMTQAFRRAGPRTLATVTVMVMLPALAHAVEFVVHYLRGTVNLKTSILASMTFTALSTVFNLFAMRRGTLIVGQGRESLLQDLVKMPGLLAAFVGAIATGLVRVLKRLVHLMAGSLIVRGIIASRSFTR
jgi:hypothetical protein